MAAVEAHTLDAAKPLRDNVIETLACRRHL